MYKKTEHSGTDEHNRSSDRANLSYVPYIVANEVILKPILYVRRSEYTGKYFEVEDVLVRRVNLLCAKSS